MKLRNFSEKLHQFHLYPYERRFYVFTDPTNRNLKMRWSPGMALLPSDYTGIEGRCLHLNDSVPVDYLT